MKKEYVAPSVEVVELMLQTCFAASGAGNQDYDYESADSFDFE